jgi:PAS domain S-box-containing protein
LRHNVEVPVPTLNKLLPQNRRSFVILAAFGLLALVLIANTFIIRDQLAKQSDHQAWVTHTQLVQVVLSDTIRSLVSAESGERGYLLTGNQVFLDNANLANEHVSLYLNSLALMTADNPVQQANIAALRPLVQLNLAKFNRTVALYQSGRLDTLKPLLAANSGRPYADDLHAILEQMVREEDSLQLIRLAKYQRSQRITHIAIYWSSAVALMGAILVAWLVLWQLRLREKLGAAQRQQAEMMRLALDAILILRPDGVIESWNHGAEQLYGFSESEAVGSSAHELLRTSPAISWPEIMAILREHGKWESELRQLAKNGREIIVSARYQLVADGVERVLKINRDITERKRLETRLRRLLDSELYAVLYWKIDGGVVDANDKFLKLSGYTREDVRAGLVNWARMTPAEYQDMDEDARRQIRETGVHLPYEKEYIRKDGARVWGMFSAVAYEDDRNEGISIIIDITERKRTEKALRESEATLQLFIESSPVALAMFDHQMRYLHASRRWRSDFGLGERDLHGLSHYDVFPETTQAWKDAHRRGLTGEVLQVDAEQFVRADGAVQWIRWEIRPWRNAEGKVAGIVIFSEDITERKQAENALLRSEKLASVGRMAATIAHEINNPLDAVVNSLYIARGAENLPDLAREYIELADGELMRIAHITRQSLGFYRESNAPALTYVNTVLDSTVDLLRNKIKAKQAVIEKQWDGDFMVTAVAGELRQVFSNLLGNSLDAIDEHGTVRLRVSECYDHAQGKRCVRVTFADNGKGIPANALQHLFEPFFTTKGVTGTGLGLWVSKQIVDKHDGRIRVRSNTSGPRRGTVFSVLLAVDPDSLLTRT